MKGLTEPTCDACVSLQDDLDDLRAEAEKEYRQLCEDHEKEIEKLTTQVDEQADEIKDLKEELKQSEKFIEQLLFSLETAAESVLLRAGLPRKEVDDVINRHKSHRKCMEEYVGDMCELFDDAQEVAEKFIDINETIKDI